MRRRVASFAVVGLFAAAAGGCSDFRSIFSAHPGAVAEVGGYELSADRLSAILTKGRGAQVSREMADYVTQMWVDHALFAQAAVTNKLPLDSAGIAAAVWSEIAETQSRRWHDTLVARRHPVDPAAVDSVYRSNDVRVLQHILFRSQLGAPTADRAAARKKAEAALRQARGGADFGSLAARLSEDPGSRIDSGFLPPSRRGQFVPAFDSAGWALAPGATSDIVETPFGYHVIKRPTVDAARSRLVRYLSTSAGARLDSIYMDSLAKANKIEVSAGGPAAMRAALNDPYGSRGSTKVVATFTGGKLTVGDLVRWLQALPPYYTSQLKQVPDSVLQRFAQIVTQNVLLIRTADAAGIRLTAEEWGRIAAQHRAQLDTLRQDMGLASPELQDSTLSPDQRKKMAMLKLDQYFDELVSGRRRVRPIPTALAGLLRDRGSYRLYPAGMNRALELARAAQAKDSGVGGNVGMPGSPFKRAPGPPPIPGAGAGTSSKAGTHAPATQTPAPSAPATPKDSGAHR